MFNVIMTASELEDPSEEGIMLYDGFKRQLGLRLEGQNDEVMSDAGTVYPAAGGQGFYP